MEKLRYLAIEDHISEFPEPITFSKDASLKVGRKYSGAEGWQDWVFCETQGQRGGWVPAQIIEMTGPSMGRALEDYTARELEVRAGQQVVGTRKLNGWVWCQSPDESTSGWLPLDKLTIAKCDVYE